MMNEELVRQEERGRLFRFIGCQSCRSSLVAPPECDIRHCIRTQNSGNEIFVGGTEDRREEKRRKKKERKNERE